METTRYCRHLYYGSGKGKTTAAAGLALRALGQGGQVVFAQFLKNGCSGELEPLRRLGAQVLSGPPDQKFTFAMTEEEKAESARIQQDILARAIRLAGERPGCLLVLDEGVDAAEKGFLPRQSLAPLLEGEARWEVVFTGHSAPGWLAERMDYLTRMEAEKHPYRQGLGARAGIEY